MWNDWNVRKRKMSLVLSIVAIGIFVNIKILLTSFTKMMTPYYHKLPFSCDIWRRCCGFNGLTNVVNIHVSARFMSVKGKVRVIQIVTEKAANNHH